MTLLELMLVLALLVVMGALALPSLKTPFENQRLRKAGEAVRIAWNKARIQAMKSGQTQMFCYDAEHGTYCIQPYYSGRDILEAGVQHGGPNVGGAASRQAPSASEAEMMAVETKALPQGVVFVSSEVRADVRAVQLEQEVQGGFFNGAQPGRGVTAVGEEAPPILFYPDGTTSEAKLVLAKEQGEPYVVVSLRSLTGIATVSDLVSADDVQLVP